MEPITTTDPLAQACARLAKHPYVTIDTEFLRESTYYPILCVMQMASPDEALVVDALAPEIDLAPFFALMADESVLKIFHAGRQDIEIIWHRAGLIPHPVFDTQIAAMVLGYGDSVSYEQLVQRITGDYLDKSHRFTDWSRRPLSKAQIAYAISDVTHLRDIYLALSADLAKRGRIEWVNEEMEILTSPDTYRAEPERAWQRVRTRARKPKELAVLMEVAAWREREAQSRDVPRGRVLKDDALGDIAVQAPTSMEKLAALRSLPRGFERSKWGEAILQAVERGLARDLKSLPRIERSRAAVNPRPGGLELRAQTQQRHLVPEGRRKLHPDRQAAGRPVQRNRHRRIAGGVEQRRERDRAEQRLQVGLRIVAAHAQHAELVGRLAHRRREQHVVTGEEAADDPADLMQHADGAGVIARGELAPGFGGRPGEGLDIVGSRLAAERLATRFKRRAGVGADDDPACLVVQLLVDERRSFRHGMAEALAQLRARQHRGHAIRVDRMTAPRLRGKGDSEPPRIDADLYKIGTSGRRRPIGIADVGAR